MSYRKTLLVHGFNVGDGGKDTVLKVPAWLPKQANQMYINYPYGRLGLFGVLFKNKRIARVLRNMAQKTDNATEVHAIGHSNGCALIVEAARQGAVFDRVILINPALNIDTVFPDGMHEIVVIHTKHDKPTQIARFFDAIPILGWLIPDAWGAMGALGYVGSDQRVINLDCSEFLKGHSDFFKEKNLRRLMPALGVFLNG